MIPLFLACCTINTTPPSPLCLRPATLTQMGLVFTTLMPLPRTTTTSIAMAYKRNSSTPTLAPSSPCSDTYADNIYTPGFNTGLDWLALPLDPLLNSSFGSDVTHAGYGPDVGGFDMLDILLMDGNLNDVGMQNGDSM